MLADVATDLDNPPTYKRKDLGPLRESWKPSIRKYYPGVKPVRVDNLPADAVFDAALRTATGMTRWAIKLEDKPAGQIEATAVTLIFRFVDDIAIRVTSGEGGRLTVDMRSKSRVGQGDIGANAARIQAYMAKLAAELKAAGGNIVEQ